MGRGSGKRKKPTGQGLSASERSVETTSGPLCFSFRFMLTGSVLYNSRGGTYDDDGVTSGGEEEYGHRRGPSGGTTRRKTSKDKIEIRLKKEPVRLDP